MNEQIDLEKNRGQLRAFDLRRLIESRLYTALLDDPKKSLRFEYDEEIPKIVIGAEKALGELLTVVFNYSWERLFRGELDVAVQCFDVKEDTLKVQFSFCERLAESIQSDGLDKQRFFRNAADDDSAFRLLDELCKRLGIDLISKMSPLGERFLAFAVEMKLDSNNSESLIDFSLRCLRGKRPLLVEDNDLYREVLKGHFIRWGISVEDVGSSENAIKLIEKLKPFDFGVFDNSLRGESGSDLARYCRTIFPPSEMRINSLSGVREARGGKCFDESLVMPALPSAIRKILARFSSGRS